MSMDIPEEKDEDCGDNPREFVEDAHYFLRRAFLFPECSIIGVWGLG